MPEPVRWVDYDNSPETTVSGRITMHHSVPKGGDLRAAKGLPFLKLDKPLLASVAGTLRQMG